MYVIDILDFICHWSTDRNQKFLKGQQIEVLYTISIYSDLLCEVGEISFGLRMGFIGSDEVLTTFLFICLFVSEAQRLGLFS